MAEIEERDGGSSFGDSVARSMAVHEQPRVCAAIESLLSEVMGTAVQECCDRSRRRARCRFEISGCRLPAYLVYVSSHRPKPALEIIGQGRGVIERAGVQPYAGPVLRQAARPPGSGRCFPQPRPKYSGSSPKYAISTDRPHVRQLEVSRRPASPGEQPDRHSCGGQMAPMVSSLQGSRSVQWKSRPTSV